MTQHRFLTGLTLKMLQDMISDGLYQLNDLPSAAVHPVTESEYQFTTTLTAGNDVYWQLRIYDKYGNSSGWNYTGDEAPRYIHIY